MWTMTTLYQIFGEENRQIRLQKISQFHVRKLAKFRKRYELNSGNDPADFREIRSQEKKTSRIGKEISKIGRKKPNSE